MIDHVVVVLAVYVDFDVVVVVASFDFLLLTKNSTPFLSEGEDNFFYVTMFSTTLFTKKSMYEVD